VNLQFPEFHRVIRERNEMTRVALECAAFVLSQALRLAPDQRKPMLALMRDLISMEDEQDNSSLSEE